MPAIFHVREKSTAKVGRYHGTPFRFHSQPLFSAKSIPPTSPGSAESSSPNTLILKGISRGTKTSSKRLSSRWVEPKPLAEDPAQSPANQLRGIQQKIPDLEVEIRDSYKNMNFSERRQSSLSCSKQICA
jgi:hypothetical protein